MKTVVIECQLPASTPRVEEVRDMAAVIDYQVVADIVQKRERVDAAFWIGRGKVQEISELIREKQIAAVIFAGQLSAGQLFRIQSELGRQVKVLDRNLLILEVFEKRAATTEAKLQIELARLRYTFSWGRESVRIKGITGQQVGWGGAGKYPYEVYEAASRKRISKIEKQLKLLRKKNENLSEKRKQRGFFIVALTGYTQSGKTTFFNRLASESKVTGVGPFTTLSTCARKINLDSEKSGGIEFILVDSIGFIEDLNPMLLDAFHTTLSEVTNSDLILLFVDAGDTMSTLIRRISTAENVLRKEAGDKPLIVCLNKIDLIDQDRLNDVVQLVEKSFAGSSISAISSRTGDKIDNLMERIKTNIQKAERERFVPNPLMEVFQDQSVHP